VGNRVSRRGWVHLRKGLKIIGITTNKMKRGIQSDNSQIWILRMGLGPWKKGLKMIGISVIKAKRGIKWDRY
jgi:hypothetical protein